ncbi:cytochrome c biogenesis protein [Methanolobus halotolerans]|uniref:Cytochrome C assembly protein n=1 Tax=Methanolobus halotolerans TaxID=2052935 RepID=A0A4E0PZS4_9EURY|nr:cytochrome c biogenesis protein [Methanolobus halotolerans]TGC09475.1 cytochrome C assembly protein [Methanolobus halotolerans]
MFLDSKKEKMIAAVTGVVMLLAIWMVFFYLPEMRSGSGEILDSSFRIFYFHLPIAFTSYLAFFVVFIASICQLRRSSRKWDVVALSAAEVGVVFAFLVLVTGSIWAKATWGWYWIWEPRLTTSLVLLLVYLAYLMLRQAVEEPESRARIAAVFGIIGFVSVPLSFLSVRLWRSAHPLMFGGSTYGSSGGGLEGTSLQLTLLVNLIAFVLLFVTMVFYRIRNEEMKEEIDHMHISRY